MTDKITSVMWGVAAVGKREFPLYAQFASKNLRKVIEGTRKNRLAYEKRTSGGRFLSIDPVTTDANTGVASIGTLTPSIVPTVT
jgi:hypothetical protein